MSTASQYSWTYNLVWKLLHNDPDAISLFNGNPFPGKPPRFIRAEIYSYRFAKPGNAQGHWWEREPLGEWIPPLSADNQSLVEFLKSTGWVK